MPETDNCLEASVGVLAVVKGYDLKIMASGGSVTADRTEYNAGDTVTLTLKALQGYTLYELSYGDSENIASQAVENRVTFTMPAGNTTVIAVFAVEETKYTVTAEEAVNGTVEALDPVYTSHTDNEFKQGALVGIVVKPEENYVLESLAVKQGDKDVTMLDETGFYMPAGNVTVTATFAASDEAKIHHPAVSANCACNGNIEYWEFDGCYYSDRACKTGITLEDTVVKATGRHESGSSLNWTWISLGGSSGWTAYYSARCAVCGRQMLEGHNAVIAADTSVAGKITYNASITLDGRTYSTRKTVDAGYSVTLNGVPYGKGSYAYGTTVTVSNGGSKFDWYIGGSKVKTGSASYTFIIMDSVEITTKEATEAQPTLSFTCSGRQDNSSAGAGKTKVIYTTVWTMPEGYTLVSAGIRRAYNVGEKPTLAQLSTNNVFSLTTRNGTYIYTVNMSAATSKKSITALAYLTYRDTSGNTKTIYTAPIFTAGK